MRKNGLVCVCIIFHQNKTRPHAPVVTRRASPRRRRGGQLKRPTGIACVHTSGIKGRAWADLAGRGWVWLDLAGFGWAWLVLAGLAGFSSCFFGWFGLLAEGGGGCSPWANSDKTQRHRNQTCAGSWVVE